MKEIFLNLTIKTPKWRVHAIVFIVKGMLHNVFHYVINKGTVAKGLNNHK